MTAKRSCLHIITTHTGVSSAYYSMAIASYEVTGPQDF